MLSASDHLGANREHAPLPGYSFQLMKPPVLEEDPRADAAILDRAGDQHLPGAGHGPDPGADVHGDPPDVPLHELAFPGVQSRPDLDPKRSARVKDGPGAVDPPRGAVERGQE